MSIWKTCDYCEQFKHRLNELRFVFPKIVEKITTCSGRLSATKIGMRKIEGCIFLPKVKPFILNTCSAILRDLNPRVIFDVWDLPVRVK